MSVLRIVVSLGMLYLVACDSTPPKPADLNPADFCGNGTHLDAETETCREDVDTTPISSCGLGTYLDTETQSCLVIADSVDDDSVTDDDEADDDDVLIAPADFCGTGTHLDDETGTCVPNLVVTSDDDDVASDDDYVALDDDSVADDDATVTDDDATVTEVEPLPTCEDDLSLSASWRTNDLFYLEDHTPVRVRTALRGLETEDLRAFLIGFVANPITDNVADPYLLIEVDPTDDRWTLTNGAAHGMSGSPVIIECRNAGALSFGIGATLSPFAFVATPIESMDDLFDFSDAAPYTPSLEPMAAVLSTGGMTFFDGAEGFLGLFDERFVVTSAFTGLTGISIADEDIPPLEAGSPISVILVTGDIIDVAAGGTVTAIDQDGRLVAFGHPFQGDGLTAYPYRAAEVQTVVASAFTSSKVMNGVGRPLGVITQDRFPGIAGTPGLVADMIEVETNIIDGGVTSYHHQVVRQPNDSSYYAGSLVANTAAWPVRVFHGIVGPGSTFFTVTLDFAEYEEPLTFTSVASSSYDPVSDMFYQILDSLRILSNESIELTLNSLTLDVSIEDVRHEYTIADVTSADEIQTSEDLVVMVSLTAYRETDPTPRAIVVPVPTDFPAGTARVSVESVGYYWDYSDLIEAETLEDLQTAWYALPHENQIIVELVSVSWTQPMICEPIDCPEDEAGDTTMGAADPAEDPEPVCEICEYVRDDNGELLKRPRVRVVSTEPAVILGYGSWEVDVLPSE